MTAVFSLIPLSRTACFSKSSLRFSVVRICISMHDLCIPIQEGERSGDRTLLQTPQASTLSVSLVRRRPHAAATPCSFLLERNHGARDARLLVFLLPQWLM